jgi:hypothetical protein
MINSFAENIYFENTNKLRDEFIKVCEEFEKESKEFEMDEIKCKDKNLLMNKFFKVFQTNDFIKMSDFLLYEVIPFIKKETQIK